MIWLIVAIAVWALCGADPAAAQPNGTGSIGGTVSSAPGESGSFPMPLAGVTVTASIAAATAGSATTDSQGNFEIDGLPAPATYSVSFSAPGYQSQTLQNVDVSLDEPAFESVYLNPLPATVSGVVTDLAGQPVYGTTIVAAPEAIVCPPGYVCGPETFSGPTGSYSLSLSPGEYAVAAMDSGVTVPEGSIEVNAGGTSTVDVRLPAPEVPRGTTAHNATRDLGYLNAQRAAAGLPGGIRLSPRWSQECAAHDVYERDNDILAHPENPKLKGASAGGAWAGLHSVLAEGLGWTSATPPWWTAPIHLIQLFTPSLSVIGIDQTAGRECATTWPGMLRPPVASDTILTYPGDGVRGVPPSENAQESPFVPGQFVGIPVGTTAGRELFVYLETANEFGPASVKILRATLAYGRRSVRIRMVDNTTPTVGPYLTGGIIIPVKPLRGRTRYTASVVVQDGTGRLAHTWSFTTAR